MNENERHLTQGREGARAQRYGMAILDAFALSTARHGIEFVTMLE